MTVWWRDAVFYQIYVRSFADSNGDGIGDLPGIIERLEYLEWLGVGALWLTPCYPSPNNDWGYDVSDYRDIHPDLGSLEDADRLIAEAQQRDMRVLFDLVPNHTSDEHGWFQDARSGRDALHRDWYVWRDPRPDGSPPNNWLSVFGGSAWEMDEPSGQYYLHNFLKSQPDLDWWNPEVREAFDDILGFWFERGVDGFRIDVAHGIIKDRALRDNIPATETDHPDIRRIGQHATYNMNQPEVHEVLQRWRALADRYPQGPILVGETWVLELERLIEFYGSGDDELHLAFNFPFIFSPLQTESLQPIVEETESLLSESSFPAWTASNHDVGRFASRWCGEDEGKIRCALMLLLTLRGAPFLFYGDEIGMAERAMARNEIRDPVGKTFWPRDPGRDRSRTPMQWADVAGAGFTTADAEPWLPFGDLGVNVASQRGDDDSVLGLTRALLSLRKRETALKDGTYLRVEAPPGVWAFERGESLLVAINFSSESNSVACGAGDVCLETTRGSASLRCDEGILELQPFSGAISMRKRG